MRTVGESALVRMNHVSDPGAHPDAAERLSSPKIPGNYGSAKINKPCPASAVNKTVVSLRASILLIECTEQCLTFQHCPHLEKYEF